jgi:hypothetical protein
MNIHTGLVLMLAPMGVIYPVGISGLVYAVLVPTFVLITTYEKNKKKHPLFILIFTSIVIYHLIPAFLILFMVVSGSIHDLVRSRYKFSSFRPNLSSNSIISNYLWVIIFATIILSWMVFPTNYILNLVTALFPGEVKEVTGNYVTSTLLGKFGFSLVDIAILILKDLGDWTILLSLSLASIILGLRRCLDDRSRFIISSIIVLSVLWSVFEITVGSPFALGWKRVLRPAVILSPLLGASLFSLSNPVSHRSNCLRSMPYLSIFFIVIIVCSGNTIAAANMFDSGFTESSNKHLSPAEISGWDWYFSYGASNRPINTLNRDPARFSNLLLGVDGRRSVQEKVRNYSTVPPHFGENNLGTNTRSGYLVITRAVKQNRLQIHPEWGVFNRSDFEHLKGDSSVNYVYNNHDIRIGIIS